MITVFSCSNRPGNKTFPFASAYADILRMHTSEVIGLLDFKTLDPEFLHDLMYDSANQTLQIRDYQDRYLSQSNKWVFVIPEYNGSFPGILKLFIDACSIRNYKETFNKKKAALLGDTDCRSGIIRGLEHLSGVLNHMGTIVYPDRLPVSQISKLLNGNFGVSDQESLLLLEKHAISFLDF